MANSFHLIITISALCSFLPNSLQDNAACKEQTEMIVDCWLHYGDPPSCKRKSSMVLCAEERFDSVLNCSSDTLRQIKRMVYSYGATESALCEEDSDLHTDIQTRKPCWSILRSCALQVMMVESDEADELCSDVMKLISVCNRISHSCASIYRPFISSIIEKSNCKGFYVVSDEESPNEDSLTQLEMTDNAGFRASVGYITLFVAIIMFSFL